MFAVIKTGGKQYRVAADEILTIERLPGEPGDAVTFEEVLFLGNGETATIGAPLVAGASVAGEIVSQRRARKIIVFKKKRRKNYRRTHGHRQYQTLVRITEILTDGAKPGAKAKAAPKKAASADDAGAKAQATQPAQVDTKPEAAPKAAKKPAASRKKAGAEKAAPEAGTDKES